VAELSTSSNQPRRAGYFHVFSALLGGWIGLSLLKFGNPVVFDGMFPPPRGFDQIIHFEWPAAWAFAGTVALVVASIPLLRIPRSVPKWVLWIPAIWLAWQWIATFDSINPGLSLLTSMHLTSVVAFFYLGLFATRGVGQTLLIWLGIGVGLCLVVSAGFEQQFGGLRETAEFYEKLERGEHPPDIQQEFDTPEFRALWETPLFRHKVQSKRVYATLFYPNTLAGVLILIVPGLLAATWYGLERASPLSRKLLPSLLGVGALLCLLWSGSKAGWLIAVGMAGLVLLRAAIPTRWRLPLLAALAVLGLTFLVVRNLDYFQRGAKSVGARAGYWVVAGKTYLDNPVTGAGPGTFMIYYGELKSDDAEMARLAHNDFIQQASDSGTIGFLAFVGFILGSLFMLYRSPAIRKGRISFFVWLGTLGWALQSVTEFGLYIPAIGWTAFLFLGLLWREAVNHVDTPAQSG
jgi:hypothetical protein